MRDLLPRRTVRLLHLMGTVCDRAEAEGVGLGKKGGLSVARPGQAKQHINSTHHMCHLHLERLEQEALVV